MRLGLGATAGLAATGAFAVREASVINASTKDIAESFVMVCDPMLATGGSAIEAINILKTDGARHIVLLTLLASRSGARRVHEAHPGVTIYTAGVDSQLNKAGYIVPGLGDAGDRLFATT